MDNLPLDLLASPTEEALGAFLEGIQGKAESLGHGQLVSISIDSKALDPLAVLESIYEPGELTLLHGAAFGWIGSSWC